MSRASLVDTHGVKGGSIEAKCPRTALIYDFDGTLCKGNLQEHSFIPDVQMTRDQFWEEVKSRTKKDDADEILVYMHFMIEKVKEKKIGVSRAEICQHGEDAPLFPGLENWFNRINVFACKEGLGLEHYIISSGLHEMIEGCSICGQFSHIFASKFTYDQDGHASWPAVAINYTTKTQYLFRINKGIRNHWDNDAVNKYTPENQRPIPFERMIFIGDGQTDIPTMKMLTHKGGHSIAVYDPNSDHDTIHELLSASRVDFVAPADYKKGEQLDIIVKGLLGRIKNDLDEKRRHE